MFLMRAERRATVQREARRRRMLELVKGGGR